MTFDEFDKITEEVLSKIRTMRDTKGKEYARSEDRFANFNRLSKDLGISREKVLWTYAAKHLDGILSYINNGRTYSDERIEGRIVDAMTYLCLLAGMVWENDRELTNAESSEGLSLWIENRQARPFKDPRCHWVKSKSTSRPATEDHGRIPFARCILQTGHSGDHQL